MTPSRTMRGYTLLEMIVSVGIFSLIMLAATGAYLKLIALDREARSTNELVTNLSFAVDSMSRAIRTGSDYKCNKTGTNCANGTSFRFTDADGRQIDYEIASGRLTQSIGGAPVALTDPRITISSLNFIVRGVDGGSPESCGVRIQPQAIFYMKGSLPTGQGDTVTFSIEGSATQRLLDLAATPCS